MKRMTSGVFGRIFSMVILMVFVLSQQFLFSISSAGAAQATTKIKHKPIKYFVSGKRISLDVSVQDKKGIEIVRCYFRTQGEADFVFVPMEMLDEKGYNAVLPAPSDTTETIEYLFLVVNSEKEIVKTQTFMAEKKKDEDAPAWQQVSADSKITVSTELSQAPSELAGFTDSITLDVVESTARFGVVAGGLYSVSASSASGTAAASVGTVTASAGVPAAAVAGAAAAVAAAGVAAAGSSDSDDAPPSGGGQCNTTTTAGGNTPEVHTFSLGKTSGSFNFSYETYGQEDRLFITYEGATIFDSGCIGTRGTRTESVSYSGDTDIITVRAEPNCAGGSGTAWEFTVGCP